MTARRGPLLLLVPVVYLIAIVVTRLMTLGALHPDRALATQLVVVPLAQMAALALALAATGRKWR